MRNLRTNISFLLIIAATVAVIGLLSANARHSRTGVASEPVCGQEIDATRSVLMCI